jgi:Tol biopolymer transport system component
VARPFLAAALATTAIGALAPARPAGAATASYGATGRVSVTTAGAQAAQSIGDLLAVSSDGRYVAFTTSAPLQADDTNGARDAYLRDRVAGTTTRVSLTDADAQISGPAELCGMSRNARYVAFVAHGANLPVATDQVYRRDRALGTTVLVSRSTAGVASSDGADSGIATDEPCPLSDDGRYVAFTSTDDALAPGDLNGTATDVFRRDVQTATTVRASVSGSGTSANGAARGAAMSADGGTIAFASAGTNLVANDSNAKWDVFVHAFSPSGTYRMSVKAGGGQVSGSSEQPSISADGLKVAFSSTATDLAAGDTNGATDVFVRNRTADTVTRASLFGAAQADGPASLPHLSDDGRYVSFSIYLPEVAVDDANQNDDVYRRDLTQGSAALVSVTHGGEAGDGQAYENAISGDGTVVAFASSSTDLVRNDTDGTPDVFARDLRVELDPFGSVAALITQQFADFEGRSPSPAERDEWAFRLGNGETTPDRFIDALAHGTAWAGKRAPLARLYWAFFLRPPDQGGMTYWTNQLTAGKKLATVAKQFAQSSEFQTKYGSKTNTEFVTLIYQNIFGRDPDPGGLAFWTGKLDAKQKTRGDVMVNFSESSEGRRVLAPQTDTILLYLGMLRTMPSKLYLQLTVSNLKGEWMAPLKAAELRGAPAYGARIVP